MLPTIIKDSLGLETGIKVTHVRSVFEKDKDRLLISGRIMGDRVAMPGFEPDIQCDVINREGQVCITSCSTHSGVFFVTKQASFSLQINGISQAVPWQDIARIELYVIFRKTG